MIYFIIIILFLSALAIIEAVAGGIIQKELAAIVTFILLFSMAAFRPVEGDHDYQTYLNMFDVFPEPGEYFRNFIIWGFFEPVYYFLPSILRYWLQVEQYGAVTIFIFAFLGCLIVMLALRKLTQFYFLSLITLFCNLFILHEMTQIRAAVAVGFFFFAIYYKENKNYLRFFCCVGISFLFHYSSLLAIPILFLSGNSINKPLYLGLAIFSLLLSFVDFSWVLSIFNFDAGALNAKQDSYVTAIQDEMLNRRSLMWLIHFVNAIVVIIYSDKIFEHNKYIYLLIKIQVIGLLAFQVLSASPTIAARVGEYFLSVHIITLSSWLCLFKRKLIPAIAICLLNTGIFFTLVLKNNLLYIEHFKLPL